MVFRRGAQDGEIPGLRSALGVPLGPNLLSIHRTALKVKPQVWLEAVLLEHGFLCTRMRGCAADLWSPGINGRQLIQEHAMLTVSFPDPSVRCCTGKYCAHQHLKKSVEHIEAKPLMVGQDEEKWCYSPDMLCNPCLAQGWKPLFIRNIRNISDIVTALRQMGFSSFILIPALMASVLVRLSFPALIFNLCLRKMVFCGHFTSDQADILLRPTLK